MHSMTPIKSLSTAALHMLSRRTKRPHWLLRGYRGNYERPLNGGMNRSRQMERFKMAPEEFISLKRRVWVSYR